MTASEKSILHALENSMFMFPEVPGHWDLPTFPGLRAHATPEVSHLFGNMVGVSTLTQENVDSVIAQVQEFSPSAVTWLDGGSIHRPRRLIWFLG